MEYIKIGKIVNTHGIKGDVKANMYTSDVLDILRYSQIFLSKEDDEKITSKNISEYELEYAKKTKNQAILKFKTIDTIEIAEEFRDFNIYIERKDLEENNILQEDEYYLVDLIGTEVFGTDDKKIGILKDVMQYSSSDIYVIESEGKEILVPAIKQYIKKIDILNKKIYVELGGLDEI